MRKFLFGSIIFVLFLFISFRPMNIQAESARNLNFSTASDLIDAVNALRATNGLPAYTPNSILMNIAQGHADYMASISVSNTHVGADGLLPFQRALHAGYPVAGDISNGSHGFFSENVTGGIGLTPQEAVNYWMGDAPHQGTMLSSDLYDVGAGVAKIGNTYYYCLDAGQSTGGTPRPFTPPPSYIPPPPTLIPNTPNADGSIAYIVQHGDTLLGIAIANNISLTDLLALNGLTMKSTIYPGQKITIRTSYTPTPTLPTLAPTVLPTITPWPTSTPTSTKGSPTSTSTPSPGLSISSARNSLIIIILAALAISGLFILLGFKRK
jgi:uncharacterized protein YkwD/LysM repeat protein